MHLVKHEPPIDFPPPRSRRARPNNLPAQLTSFVGRERSIAEIKRLLTEVRLLTLTGPAGSGKTRLALQVAAELVDPAPRVSGSPSADSERTPGPPRGPALEDGAYFVILSPIRDPGLVTAAITQALRIPTAGRRPPLESLKEHLRDRALLLVLDGFEHVLDAAPLLPELLAACSRLKILVTSRVPLQVSGEQAFEVPPLTLPDVGCDVPAGPDAVPAVAGYEAVCLFVERARAVTPDFVLTADNARAVVELCRRLDGLPLAVELAAARLRLLPPAAMLERLTGTTPTPSLQLLTGGHRDQPPRLQTLRDAIGWSQDLLDPAEQALFRRLAVFVGGCTLEAAEGLGAGDLDPTLSAPEVLDGLESLVAKSLLRRVDAADGEPRFAMLETIREYALECLAEAGELVALRRWHANYYLSLAEAAEPRLRGPEQRAWLDRLEVEHDNLRAALEWSQAPDGDPDLGLRLSGALAWFWQIHDHIAEGRRCLAMTLARASTNSTARVKALYGAGWLAHLQRDSAAARPLLEESLALARELGDDWAAGWALHLLGSVAYFEGDAGAARSRGEASLALARRVGDGWLVAWALHLLGLVAHIEADYPAARPLYEESLAIRRALSFREGVGTLLVLLGMLAYRQGEYSAARARLRESLPVLRDLGALWIIENALASFAALAARLGQPERAVRLAAAAASLGESIEVVPIPLVETALAEGLEAARRALGETAYAAAWAAGRSLPADEAVAEAMAVEASPQPSRPRTCSSDEAEAHPADLTAREVEVLRLIVTGRSNKEIADALVVSLATVERHVTHIYRKIGARRRADATAFAVRHGLDGA